MALTVTVEDGTGVAGANSYISRTACDSYYEGHLYATSWTGATNGNKDAALVMATRVLDASVIWNGFKTENDQPLQWPRQQCPDPDRYKGLRVVVSGETVLSNTNFVDDDEVPQNIKNATCELARFFIAADRTADPDGEGIKRFGIYHGIYVDFDPKDRRPVLPLIVQNMVNKYGTPKGESGPVKLTRS